MTVSNGNFDLTGTVYEDTTVKFLVCDTLAGVPLFGYYILQIDKFEPGDIRGTLMDPPFQFFGPFESQAAARAQMLPLIGIDE